MSLFVSESYIGTHRPSCVALELKLVAFTFIPTFFKLDKEVRCLEDIMIPSAKRANLFIDGMDKEAIAHYKNENSNDFIDILCSLHKKEGGNIYLGQDNDVAGNVMASLLYHHLIKRGIPKESILRIPLLEVGYDWGTFVGGSFYPIEQLIKIMEKRRKERYMMNVSPRTQFGYRVLYALHLAAYINKNIEGYRVPRKNSYTSTITYIVKFLLGEKN
ncbi:MAG: Unknown protein [uncultured Sulfurovum sp.]|uniref:Uncharacterized protein n=1 Tax=uncultured Sulfurovum sp. TaxID=269237 RepID=A0A6S6SVX1_9BACT|nr:MAG: Unknown protein [uncultured Sulfurovum sp.]